MAGKRSFTSALDLVGCDALPFCALAARLAARGVRVRGLSELRSTGTPGLTARLHALMNDVPRDGPATPLSRQVFGEAGSGLTGVTRERRGAGDRHPAEGAGGPGGPRPGGIPIRTDNASDSAPMLAINDRLGFVRDPASVSYLLKF